MSFVERLRTVLERGRAANIDVVTGESSSEQWGGPEMVDVFPQIEQEEATT